jgi:tetratricopeptide (TPR) repeat protein
MSDRSLSTAILIVTLALFTLCASLLLNNLCIYTPDSARYLSLALSMSRGEGYRDLFAPGEPVHVNFPPVYPLLLLPAALTAPARLILAGKVLNILIGICALAMLYLMLAKVTSFRRSAMIAALTALNPLFVVHAAEVMSESAYLLVSSLALWLVIDADRGRLARVFAAGAMAGAACLTRYSGVSLIIAGGAVFCLRREWRRGLIFAASAIMVVIPWCMRDLFYILRGGGIASWGYGSSMAVLSPAHPFFVAELVRRLVGGVVRYSEMARLLLFPFLFLNETGLEQYLSPIFLNLPTPGPAIVRLITVCAALGVLAGIYRCARDRAKMPLTAYFIAYVAVLVFYPVREVRFLIPVSAFLWLFLIEGVGIVARLTARSMPRAMGCMAAVLVGIYVLGCLACNACLAVSNLSFLGAVRRDIPLAGRFKYDLSGAASWLKKNTPPESVILCDRADLFFLTGRKTVSGGQYGAVFGLFERSLSEHKVAYIVSEAPAGVGVFHRLMANAVMFDFEKAADFSGLLIHKVTPRVAAREPYRESYERPIDLLIQEARKRPDSPDVHRELGYFYFREQRFDKAADEFRKALDLDPRCPVTWFNLGSVYLDTGRHDDAIAAFEKALAVRSADLIEPLVKPSMRIAQLKKEIGEAPDGSGNYRRYVEAAWLYFQMKEYLRAIEELGRASELQPALAEPHVFMGDCYAKMGRKNDAMKSYKRALELDPSLDRARKGIDALRER